MSLTGTTDTSVVVSNSINCEMIEYICTTSIVSVTSDSRIHISFLTPSINYYIIYC